jgi:hypothetical protein
VVSFRLCAAVVATALAALAAGCGGSGQPSLAKLASDQTAYVGKEVSTAGVVERQRSGNGSAYYVLADPAQDLVLLEPAETARRYQGEQVTVHGRFELDPRQGRVIHVVSIRRS